MTSSRQTAAPEAVAAFHPLDPLTFEEVRIATQTVKRERGLGEAHRFPLTRLEEPTKAAIEAWEGGAELDRIAFVLVLDRQTGEAFEALVDVRAGAIVRTKPLPVHEPPYGQPPVMIEEFARCEKIVKADPAWRRAVMRRGLSEAELELVQVDPFSSGFFDRDFERGRRIVRAVSYWRVHVQDNAYATRSRASSPSSISSPRRSSIWWMSRRSFRSRRRNETTGAMICRRRAPT